MCKASRLIPKFKSNLCLCETISSWLISFNFYCQFYWFALCISDASAQYLTVEITYIDKSSRLQADSLLLENPLGGMQRRTQHKRTWWVLSVREWYVKPHATSTIGITRQAKRETAMVSYKSILDAQHSGDGVILLVSLWSLHVCQ